MSRQLNWIHISDLHLRADDATQYDVKVVSRSLLEDLRNLSATSDLTFDLVFFSGDLAFSGKAAEYAFAGQFLQELSHSVKVPLERIYLVPGNHDVDRSLISPLFGSPSRLFQRREDVSRLLGKPDEVSLFTSRQGPYYSFIRQHLPWAANLTQSSLSYTRNLELNGVKLTIVGLNSAWLSGSDSDKGNLLVGERQLLDALEQAENPDILVAMVHHPLSDLMDFDAASVGSILNQRADFVLHGHLHVAGAVHVGVPGSEVFFMAAGAAYEGRSERLAYNCVTCDLESGKARVYLRRYSDTGRFWAADTLTYPSATSGIIDLQLPERISQKPQPVTTVVLAHPVAEVTLSGPEQDRGPAPDVALPPERPEPVVVSTQVTGSTNARLAELHPVAPEVPQELIEVVRSGRCILFAGAGCSLDAKLPTWPEMVHELIEKSRNTGQMDAEEEAELAELFNQQEWLLIAEYCLGKLRRHRFAKYLRSRLSDANRVSRTHRLLAQIPFRAAVTTNYDPFLEHQRANARVILPDDLEKSGDSMVTRLFENNETFPVIKMHGSYDDEGSIVLTHTQIRKVLYTKPRYREFLVRLFKDATFFFCGYSFRDPNIDSILQEIMTSTGDYAPPHYALLPNPGRIRRQHLSENYNIDVISYEIWDGSHVAATQFIERLATICGPNLHERTYDRN